MLLNCNVTYLSMRSGTKTRPDGTAVNYCFINVLDQYNQPVTLFADRTFVAPSGNDEPPCGSTVSLTLNCYQMKSGWGLSVLAMNQIRKE